MPVERTSSPSSIHAVVAHDDGADNFLFQVQRHPHDRVGAVFGPEFEQFAGERAGEAVDAGDAVAGFDDGADLGRDDLAFEAFNLLPNQGRDFFWSYSHNADSFGVFNPAPTSGAWWTGACARIRQ